MNRYPILLAALFIIIGLQAQTTQTVKGKVIDKNTLQTLPGANIFIVDKNDNMIGGSSDLDGNFTLENVPLGRHIFQCTFIGYEPWVSGNLEVTSAKEVIMTIELATSVFTTTNEVVVEADKLGGSTNNEFTTVSGRSFTSEETQRYAGSINDPGRMALSMPGVQVSDLDNENTMVVRGNAPFGFMWRLEGMEMPNPNHFAQMGTSGGGISALSIFVLGESDFLNGGFAAEYGNASAGVVDMHFRKGNTENHEHRFQIGVIGIDFASEGPISKKKDDGTLNSSYLINYRYSTLGLLSSMGIRVVNPNVSNVFQDLSFNLFFPISKKTFINFYGLGGLSDETKDPDPDGNTYADLRTYTYPTNLGVAGLTLTHLINDKSYLYSAVSFGGNYASLDQDTVNDVNIPFQIEYQKYYTSLLTGTFQYNRQFSKRFNTKSGIYLTRYSYDINSYYYDFRYDKNITLYQGTGNPVLTELFTQGIYNVSRAVDFQAGLHAQHLNSNGDFNLEPRLGLTLKPSNSSSVSLAYGHHSRVLPWSTYNTKIYNDATDNYSDVNSDLEFLKTRHISLMYNQHFPQNVRLRIEPFYQNLYEVPVSVDPNSTLSVLNEETIFYAEEMDNIGSGRNYGMELTVEKFFSNQFFFLASNSIFKSEYKTNNGGPYGDTWHNTRYNTNFSGALTLGKEWELSNDTRLEVGSRAIYSLGLRHSPIDSLSSRNVGRLINEQSSPYSERLKDYARIDLRVAYRKNTEKRSWKLSLDIQNLGNRKNLRRPYYDRRLDNIGYDLQSGLIPAISYILDF